MKNRKVFIGIFIITLLILVATIGALASTKLIEGNIRSFVVDIAQSVPVEISAPIELESGEMITVTAPITVNVELRVSVDGKGVVEVMEEAVQEPTITVSDTVTHEPTDAVGLRNLAWRVISQENLGAEFNWTENVSFSTSGTFIRLGFEIKNMGDGPAHLLQFEDEVNAFLVDERDRQFAEFDSGYQFNELCKYANINPGLTVNCIMVFEVAKDVNRLTLRLTRDDETVEIPLAVSAMTRESIQQATSLGHIVTAINITTNNAPIGITDSFSASVDFIYVVAEADYVEKGTMFFARWSRNGQPFEDSSEITADQDYYDTYLEFHLQNLENSFEEGDYSVQLFVNGESTRTVNFTVE